jgi:hypothetical protein
VAEELGKDGVRDGRSAIGVPGCPEFAFCTASIARVRIVSTESASTFLVPRSKVVPFAVSRIVCTLSPYVFQNHQDPVRRAVAHGYSRRLMKRTRARRRLRTPASRPGIEVV